MPAVIGTARVALCGRSLAEDRPGLIDVARPEKEPAPIGRLIGPTFGVERANERSVPIERKHARWPARALLTAHERARRRVPDERDVGRRRTRFRGEAPLVMEACGRVAEIKVQQHAVRP